MIHINEDLEDGVLEDIEYRLNNIDGVEDCFISETNHHLLMLDYDGRKISSKTLLQQVRANSNHAQLVGL